MFFPQKRTDLNIVRYDGFHIQRNYDCDGRIRTLFFESTRPLDKAFIEYLKPFGYPFRLPGNIIEIQRDKFFRLMLPLGQTGFHAAFKSGYDPTAEKLLIQQVYRAVNNIVNKGIEKKCPECAIEITGGRFCIDLSKCTYCLDCIV